MNGKPINAAERRVRRALLQTLAVICAALLLAGAALLWRQLAQAPAAPSVEAVINTPDKAKRRGAEQQQRTTLMFKDITDSAGIRFVHINGAYGERLMPETMGSGAAFFDYDNDGDQDLFLVNSTYWADHQGPAQPRHALYANDGAGHFRDVSEQAGLALSDYGMGVAVGDFDGDGWRDLFIACLGRDRLLRNQQGRFIDISDSAGVSGGAQDWSSSAAFFDYDRDGDLDLFVGNYVDWTPQDDLAIDFKLTGLGRAYGAPDHFVGTYNRLYRNDGEGRFTDVSQAAGIRVDAAGRPAGKALGLSPVDYDNDGWLDLLVANDTVGNFLYRNRGDGRFEEIGAFEGIAFDRNGKATGAMGIDSAHYRNDRELGIAIGNFANEMTSLYVSVDGRAPFADEAMLEGLGTDTRLALTFGLFFFDADLDGRLDLLQANGHLEHEINRVQPSQQYAQPAQLFWNCAECANRFQRVEAVGDLSRPLVGRAAAYADIDADGDLDVVITQNGRSARLLRNDQQSGNHWLRIKLHGKAGNRHAIGARLQLRTATNQQTRTLMPTRSYMSQVEDIVTFGLGQATRVDLLQITWPDGQVQRLPVEGVDRLLEVRQP
jgi:hypothetical protein